MRRTAHPFPLSAAAALALALFALPASGAEPARLELTVPALVPDAPLAAKPAALPVKDAPKLPAGISAEIKALEERARAGEIDAQVELAEFFASGTKPTAQDAKRAMFWYGQAAERGDADAGWALASLHRHLGEIVPEARSDMEAAVAWYRRAADLGNAEAMYDLGLLYAEGDGVERDPLEAARWFEQAADAGIARALFMLGALFEQGVDGAPDLETASAWYARSAETGDITGAVAVKRLAEGGYNVAVAEWPLQGAKAPAAKQPQKSTPQKARAAAAAVPVDKAGVKEIQTRLQKLGYKTGKPDGHLGKRTAAAIRAYQKSRKLPVDGRATRALLEHLRGRA